MIGGAGYGGSTLLVFLAPIRIGGSQHGLQARIPKRSVAHLQLCTHSSTHHISLPMAPRNTQRTQNDHQRSMLAMLDEREVERRAEYAEFPRLLPSDDYVDEQDSPCPILDSWFNEGGAEAVRCLTNFSPREFIGCGPAFVPM
ncbi:unnamed protein product [Phytophthora fragariaefolia]|uniref:Unnamed protein product n=1 Tax=Phytophthora fragariaefolia TaxID=1490495 RepID=A0A9W6YNR3_9STRA|nr:unnamed protein product [Phytophthora fragariaefolia]